MISLRDVTYNYNGKSSTLEFPAIEVSKGEPCLLLGESGSGKTTLLHLVGGLLRADQGIVSISNTNITQLSETELDKFRAKHIGFIFQKNHLISALSVKMNLLLAPYLAGEIQDHQRVEEVLTQLDLFDKRDAKINELSLGQAQRVAIARSVINKPDLILADEPTSALDNANCERAINLLLSIAQQNNSTLMVATHDHRLKSIISKQIHLKPQIRNLKSQHA
jgi:ABC-type lipoprotein export system ATPase subunit